MVCGKSALAFSPESLGKRRHRTCGIASFQMRDPRFLDGIVTIHEIDEPKFHQQWAAVRHGWENTCHLPICVTVFGFVLHASDKKNKIHVDGSTRLAFDA